MADSAEKVISDKGYRNIRNNNRISIFLVCLFISVIAWVFTALNKPYTGSFTFKTRYSNLPFQKNITSELPKEITVELEAKGFKLVAYSFRQKLDVIDLDVNALIASLGSQTKTVVVPSRNILTAEVTGMQPDMTIRHVTPEFINFDFSQKFRKRVPVSPDISYSCKKQFYSPLGYILKPDSIEISGPAHALKSISRVTTERLRLFSLDKKTIAPLHIKTGIPGVEFYPDRVWAYFPVEELAEETIKVPVETGTSSKGGMLLLPDMATVIYQAPLRLIDRINVEEFRVCASMEEHEKGKGSHTRLNICRIPRGVHKAGVEPMFIRILTAR